MNDVPSVDVDEFILKMSVSVAIVTDLPAVPPLVFAVEAAPPEEHPAFRNPCGRHDRA